LACFPLLFFSCGSGLSGVKQAEVGGMVVHTVHSFCYLQALWWNGHKNAFGKVLKQLMSCLRFGRLASDARRPAHSSLLMSMSRSIIPGKQYAEYIYKYVMLLLVLKSAQGKSRNSLQSNLSLRSTMGNMNAVGGSNDYVCSQEPKKVLERAKMRPEMCNRFGLVKNMTFELWTLNFDHRPCHSLQPVFSARVLWYLPFSCSFVSVETQSSNSKHDILSWLLTFELNPEPFHTASYGHCIATRCPAK